MILYEASLCRRRLCSGGGRGGERIPLCLVWLEFLLQRCGIHQGKKSVSQNLGKCYTLEIFLCIKKFFCLAIKLCEFRVFLRRREIAITKWERKKKWEIKKRGLGGEKEAKWGREGRKKEEKPWPTLCEYGAKERNSQAPPLCKKRIGKVFVVLFFFLAQLPHFSFLFFCSWWPLCLAHFSEPRPSSVYSPLPKEYSHLSVRIVPQPTLRRERKTQNATHTHKHMSLPFLDGAQKIVFALSNNMCGQGRRVRVKSQT